MLREDVALLDARLSDLLKRVDSGESGDRWRQAKKTLSVYAKARNTDDEHAAFADLREAIHAGVEDYQAWDEVGSVLEQRRKLVESERKRLVELQQVVSVQQAMLLVTQVVDSVRRHVTDRAVLAGISADVGRLLTSGAQDPGVAESA